MQTKTITELTNLITALAGVPSFTASELANILEYINRRAYQAYVASQSWPRFIISSEPRSVIQGQVVPTEEDSFFVYGAGTDGVNGLFTRNGTANSQPRYSKHESDGITVEFDIEFDGSTDWQILTAANAILYDITDSSSLPPTSGWAVNTGDATPPLLRDVAPIGEFIRIHRTEAFRNRSSAEYSFSVSADGAQIMNLEPTSADVAWISYKKQFANYTTESTDFPLEWFQYVAHASYADFLRGDDQTDKALAEEANADNYLMLELEKVDNIANNNTINQRFTTHGTQQARF